MKRPLLFSIFLVGTLVIFSVCPAYALSIDVAKLTFSKNFNDAEGIPYDITNSFSPTDNRVYASIEFDPVKTGGTIEWMWYDPSGTLYYSVPVEVKKNDNWAYGYIGIISQKAASKLGEWTVDLRKGGIVIDSKKFRLVKQTTSTIPSSYPMPVITTAPYRDCPGITECGSNCCAPGEGCCHTRYCDVCYNPLTHDCTYY